MQVNKMDNFPLVKGYTDNTKQTVALIITGVFIMVFTLRGGILHEVLNFSYVFAAATFLAAIFLCLRFLIQGYPGEKRTIATALSVNLHRIILEPGSILLLLWVTVLTSLMFFTYFYSPAPTPAFLYKAFSYLFMHFALLFFYFLPLDTPVIKKCIKLVALISLPLLSYQQLYSYFTTGSMITFPLSLYGRAHGLLYCANEFAKNVVLVILILLFFIIVEKFHLSIKIACMGGIALMLLMLAYSGSRGGFVMFFVGGALIWFFFINTLERRKKLFFYILSAVVVGLFATFLTRYDFFHVRFFDLLQQGGNLSRIFMMSLSWEMLMGNNVFHFLFGYGIESWPTLIPYSTTPHNFIVEYLIEFGFVGGLLITGTLFFLLFYPLWVSRSKHREGLIPGEDYSLLKILFILALSNLIPGLFNISIPTNMGFIFFAGLYFSCYRSICNRYITQ